MNTAQAKRVLETALLTAGQPLSLRDLRVLFDDALGADTLRLMLQELELEWAGKGLELSRVASGWRFQSRPELRVYLDRLHPENPPNTPAPCWRPWPSSPTVNRSPGATWKTFAA